MSQKAITETLLAFYVSRATTFSLLLVLSSMPFSTTFILFAFQQC
jgi:hypothetical protein